MEITPNSIPNQNYSQNNVDGPQISNPNKNLYIVIGALGVICIAFISFFIFYFVFSKPDNNLNNTNQTTKDNKKTEDTDSDGITSPKPNNMAHKQEVLKTRIAFANMSEGALKDEGAENINLSNGYTFVTSLLSNDKTKLVYAEITENARKANVEAMRIPTFTYNVFVQDLKSAQKTLIYSFDAPKQSFNIFEPKKAYAGGGCPFVYLPIHWSMSDKKVILNLVCPVLYGSEGQFALITIDVNTKETQTIHEGFAEMFYTPNYGKVIFTDGSMKSPTVCGPTGQRNNGAIVLFDIEQGTKKILKEEPNSDYEIKGLVFDKEVSDKQVIQYVRSKVTEVDQCAVFDMNENAPVQQLDF
ncbi:MAG: hypothetical protein E6Q58_01655 [Niabella sp.]|nr:MAG: hypothetical protein E6Q58_01655 [Niabella sp.]